MGLNASAKLRKLAAKVENDVARKLRLARESECIEQKEAAERFEISESRWGGYERKDRAAPLWLIRAFPAKFEGRTLYWLFDLNDPRQLSEQEAHIIELARSIVDDSLRAAALSGVEAHLQSTLEVDRSLRNKPRQEQPQSD